MAARESLPEDDPRHGTVNGYGNRGCRCDACTTAHRENHRKYMQQVLATKRLLRPDLQHGTNYCYNVGCRCDACRAAKAATSRVSKARLRARAAEAPGG